MKGNKTMGIIIIALLVILIAVGGILAYVLTRDKEEPVDNSGRATVEGRGVVATEDNISQVLEELEAGHNDAQYRVNMSTSLEFDRWDQPTQGNYIRNHKENTRTVYVEIFLDNEDGTPGEMIYSSPFIPVGEEVKAFPLDQEVSAGVYTATVVFHLVDDEQNEITTVALGIDLTVKR